MTKIEVLSRAAELVSGDRELQYGDSTQNLKTLAELWRSLIGIDLESAQVALMLAALKLMRLAHDHTHTDSWVDLAGYAAIGAEACEGIENE
jgi:hypothetical protein